jgi:hypothetical protein
MRRPNITAMWPGKWSQFHFRSATGGCCIVTNQIVLLIDTIGVKQFVDQRVIRHGVVVIFGTSEVNLRVWHQSLKILKQHAMHEDIPKSSNATKHQYSVSSFVEILDGQVPDYFLRSAFLNCFTSDYWHGLR